MRIKLVSLIVFTSIMHLSAASFAQRLTLSKKSVSVGEVFKEIRKQTGFTILYDAEKLDVSKKLSVDFRQTALAEVLERLLPEGEFSFVIEDKNILVRRRERNGLIDNVRENFSEISVTGKVLDEVGQPIGGASVLVKITGKGVSTRPDGTFVLAGVEEGATLVVKFIGFETVEFPARKEVGLIRMKMATNDLDAVQVQAYGITSKRLTTSNISSIRAEDIEKQPVSNPLLALQGRVPGLVVTPVSGFAGGTTTVRIQGYNSIRSGNDPFYVVDGVPYSAYTVQANTRMEAVWGRPEQIIQNRPQLSAGSSGNPLNFINPMDIESIEILKDADATAIYGSKAANGAIIITTKKGKAGPMRIDASVRSGIDKITRTLDFLSYEDYVQMRLDYKKNSNEPIYDTDYDVNGHWGNIPINRNYQDDLLHRTVANHNAQLSFSGGTTMTNYRINLGYNRQNGVFGKDLDDQKLSLGVNLNSASTNRKFKVDLSIVGMLNDNRLPYLNPMNELMYLAPNSPAFYNADGTLNWALNNAGFASWTNPMATLEKTNRSKTNNLNTNLLLSYEILPDLKLISNLGYNMMDMKNLSKQPLTAVQPADKSRAGLRQTNIGDSESRNYTIEPQLSYNRRFGDYKIDFLIGSTIQKSSNTAISYGGSNFPSDDQMDNLPIAVTRYVDGFQSRIYRYNAAFARINLNKGDEFLLNLTGRRDGSSRFGPNNRFQNFAAIGAGWIFTERNWVKENFPVISFGKLKMSYGITGNDQIGDYTYMNLYNSFAPNISYQAGSAIVSGGLSNDNLQWERNRKFNIGLDLGVLKDRISFSANYAINRSDNLLQQIELPSNIKVGNIAALAYVNFPGLVENKSLEFSLSSENLKKNGFIWKTQLNFTNTSNILKSLPDKSQLSGVLSNLNIGESILSLRLNRFSGIDPLTGVIIGTDLNGNPSTEYAAYDDQTSIIDLMPKYTGGISNSFTYKGVSLDIFLQFQKQNMMRYLPEPNFGIYIQNAPSLVLGRWKNPGDITPIVKAARTESAYSPLDVGYEDASFLRVKNVFLSWDLPSAWLSKVKLRQIRLSAQAQNLWTITNYSGLDPETGISALPLPRTLVFGLNVGF